MKTLLISGLFFLYSYSAFSQQDQHLLLQGKIGINPITIDIPCKECEGTYYYKERIVCVDVSNEEDTITLTGEKDRWGKNPGEITFRLVKQKGDRWKGTYTKKDTVLNFRLNTIDIKTLPHKYGYLPFVDSLKKEDPFLYAITANKIYDLKISGNNFKFDSLSTKTKRIVENILFAEVIYKMVRPCEGEYDSEISNVSLCMDMLSFQIGASWDGGAHPDFGTQFFQIDLKKEKKVELDEIVAAEDITSNIIGILSQTPKQFIAITDSYKESNGECNYFDGGALWPAGFSCEGIIIQASFSRALRACDDPTIAVIPFELLKDRGLLKNEYLYLAK